MRQNSVLIDQPHWGKQDMKAAHTLPLIIVSYIQTKFCLISVSALLCSLPSVTGPCRAYFQRYFYDAATGQCQEFVYGGCRGNANRFDTIQECQNVCAPESN